MSFEKWVDAGLGQYGRVFVAVRWDGSRLSITGVEGPKRNGDAVGGCGQCRDALTGITEPLVDVVRLRAVWDRWHLNDMRAGCEHQRAEGWTVDRCSEPCPTCGYKYGTAWLREEVPADVIEFLRSLPASDACPWRL